MHEKQHTFVRTAAESFALGGPVYEFGFAPMDLPGLPSLRDCFLNSPYVGCQLYEEVVLANPESFARLPFANESAQTIVCLDLFERLPQPSRALREFIRILQPGGALIVAASVENLPPHGGIGRLQPRFLREVLAGFEVTLVGWQGAIDDPHSIFGIGFKRPTPDAVLNRIQTFLDRVPRALGGVRGWPARLFDVVAWGLGIPHGRLWRDSGPVDFLVDLPGTCAWPHSGVPASPHSGKASQRLDLME